MKVLVIGGVAAGTKAAAKLKRELGDNAEILILTKGEHISYAGCGLPYYVGDLIHVESELPSGTESAFPYDKLILACGADPVRPPIPGIDLEGVYFMRTPADAVKLRGAVEAGAKRAVVVGGGFIGLEIAENLLHQGLRVSVVEMAPHTMPGFDPDFTDFVENHLGDAGITLFTGDGVTAIEGEGKVAKLRTGRRNIKTDIVVMSVGIRANTAWLADTGLEFAPNKTLVVDEHMRTLDPDVFAVGDCCFIRNRLTKQPAYSPMGSSANIEGRLCAKFIGGSCDRPYAGVLGTTVVKLPGINAGKTGISAEAAKEAGFDPVCVTVSTDDKAHYFPGADAFTIRLVADRGSRKLLGLQVMGPGAVDKIVDIAVTAISLGATLEQLENLDFAYAPPFSTAIHPFAVALTAMQNKLAGELEGGTYDEAMAKCSDWIMLDVGKTPGLPQLRYCAVGDINGPLEGITTDASVLLICLKGKNSYLAQNRLKRYGYTNTFVLEGGLTLYKYREFNP